MKRFFLVTGPEGSGTYMMAEALASCGVQEVIRGQQTYGYPIDYRQLIPDMPDLIFTHRSLPAAGEWPDLASYNYCFRKAGYETLFIFMAREIYATSQSQIRRGAVKNWQRAFDNIKLAYEHLLGDDEFYVWNWIPVSYEAFTQSEGFRRWLFTELLDLPMPTIEIRQGENEKYYE